MRIGICGTGGVGKSTLIEQVRPFLEERGYEVVTEITRKIKEQLGKPINYDQSSDYNETQLLILGAHLSNLAKPKMVSDRCLIDGYAYTEYLSLLNKVDNPCRDTVANALEAGLSLYDLIIYIPIEFEVEDDGVRSVDESFRRAIDKIMKDYIAEIRVNRGTDFIHEITGSVEQRVQQFKTLIINQEQLKDVRNR